MWIPAGKIPPVSLGRSRNRIYQVNYNPENDEDFSCYYDSYNNCDYNGTGIQLRVTGEVSPKELIKLIAPTGIVLTSKYELIEYINDVNREYAAYEYLSAYC